MRSVPPRHEGAKLAPVHAELLEAFQRLRREASDLVKRHRRVPHVRAGSREAVFLLGVAWMLEDAETALRRAEAGDGELAVDFEHGSPRVVLRQRCEVIDLAEARRRLRG